MKTLGVLIMLSVFIMCLCRFRYLHPSQHRHGVAAYYALIGLSSLLSAIATIGSAEHPWMKDVPEILLPLGVFGAMAVSATRWLYGAPLDTKR